MWVRACVAGPCRWPDACHGEQTGHGLSDRAPAHWVTNPFNQHHQQQATRPGKRACYVRLFALTWPGRRDYPLLSDDDCRRAHDATTIIIMAMSDRPRPSKRPRLRTSGTSSFLLSLSLCPFFEDLPQTNHCFGRSKRILHARRCIARHVGSAG